MPAILDLDRLQFGHQLRSRRAKAGLSRAEFAARVGVGPRIVESWEQGLKAPRIFTLPRIAAVLGCGVDDLLRAGPDVAPVGRGRPRKEGR